MTSNHGTNGAERDGTHIASPLSDENIEKQPLDVRLETPSRTESDDSPGERDDKAGITVFTLGTEERKGDAMSFAPPPYVIPDGGYGWVIVYAVFMITFICVGLPSAWGVYQRQFYYEQYFPGATNFQLAFIGSVGAGCQMLFGSAGGRVSDKIGPRNTALLGTVFMTTGLVLASFATQVWHLYLTYGIITGIGAGFAWVPSAAVTPSWFLKRRGTAVGIAAAGGGFGGMALGPMGQALLDHLGWQWALRVTGFVTFAVLASSALLLRLPPGAVVRPRGPFLDWKMFSSGTFLRLLAMGFLIAWPYFLPFHFISEYAFDQGYSKEIGAMLTALMNATAGVGRILTGLLSDKVGHLNMVMVSFAVPAFSILVLWTLTGTSLPMMIVFSVAFGAFSGGFIVLLPVSAAFAFGTQGLGTTLGMLQLGWVSGFMAGSPTAGAIIDAYTTTDNDGNILRVNFIPAMMFGGAMYVGGLFFATWERVVASKGKVWIKV
ncbi:MFS general substrate transporter [Gonapodya prolifera JEL478]|uniref:MFS general substrate transporter n=1 Tax=Gonapodya prolifera (strain JEL478) TaxID=1344416 RepID=A0A139ADT1_GONPJ|nr:MFS general substrate transporter [Gonapodya prolifera JEL478]|eukprot:KXS14951.1 MFS general substrate transporter [Gonapodya prolifera JEL478]